ncbi:MAG: hypothetical protein R3C05_06220 [Pirellulaceae bacterium]
MRRTFLLIASMLIGWTSPLFAQSTTLEATAVGARHVRIERGDKVPVVDAVGWVMGIPRKILLWDSRAENHHVSDQTVVETVDYLQRRNLQDTLVRVNQYAPIDEWHRLTSNHRVGAGWRYTFGAVKWIGYTVLPGRVFGGDEYNPYTNTLYVYSDMPTIALAEAAYARDIARREYPGTYASAQYLPLASIWHETLATDESLQYVEAYGSSESESKVRHDLYARYGSEIGGAVGAAVGEASALGSAVGAVGGHVYAAGETRSR